jgi:hypothetical protein
MRDSLDELKTVTAGGVPAGRGTASQG